MDLAGHYSTADWDGGPVSKSDVHGEAVLWRQAMRGLARLGWHAGLNWNDRLQAHARLPWHDYAPVIRNGAIIGAMGALGFSVALYTSQPGLMKKVDRLVQAELALLPNGDAKPHPDAARIASSQPAPILPAAAIAPVASDAPAATMLAAAVPDAAAPATAASVAPAAPAALQDAPVLAAAQPMVLPAAFASDAGPQPLAGAPAAAPVQAAPVQARVVQAVPVPVQAVPLQAQTVPVQAVPVQAVPVQAAAVQAEPTQIREAAASDIAPPLAQPVLAPALAPVQAMPAAAPAVPAPPPHLAAARVVRMSPAMLTAPAYSAPAYAAPVRLRRATMLVALPRIPTIEPSATEMRTPGPRAAARASLGGRGMSLAALAVKPRAQRSVDVSKFVLPDWLTRPRPVRPSVVVMSEKPHYLVAAVDARQDVQKQTHQDGAQKIEHAAARPAAPGAVAAIAGAPVAVAPVAFSQRDDNPASPQPQADELTEAASRSAAQAEARALPVLRQSAAPRFVPPRWSYGQRYYAAAQPYGGYYGGQYMPPPPPAYGYGYGYGYGQ